MEKNIYIAGAHSRGQTFREYVTSLFPETVVAAYLVDDLSENKAEIDGVGVKAIGKESGLNVDYPVYIATRGVYHGKISRELETLGMKYIRPVDAELDSWLRNAYVRKVFREENREFCKIDGHTPGRSIHARIYVVSTIYDKEPETPYDPMPEERIIQAGAALVGGRLEKADTFDDTGDNISIKNKQFCELTVIYWIWKNAQQEVVGLAHYRRHFILPEDWLDWMNYNRVDVILPVPLYVAPNVAENYRERHDPSDWEYMMGYLKRHSPSDYEAAQEFFKRNLYSPCNMFIMRKEVLDELCEWLFPILFAAAEHGGEKVDSYQNRYPGFLSERLITFFFEKNRERFHIAYADKVFLR